MKYAGIGHRGTPEKVRDMMTNIGSQLAKMGFILRSGNALGADQAWEEQVPKKMKEIFIIEKKPVCPHGIVVDTITQEQWDFVVSHYHGGSGPFGRLSAYVQYLFMRNLNILCGKDLDDKVDFVAYWHEGEHCDGGTGHTIAMAKTLEIPCFNIWSEKDQQAMDEFVNQLMEKNSHVQHQGEQGNTTDK